MVEKNKKVSVEVEEGWRVMVIKDMGRLGKYYKLMVKGKKGEELKMVMFEVEEFLERLKRDEVSKF